MPSTWRAARYRVRGGAIARAHPVRRELFVEGTVTRRSVSYPQASRMRPNRKHGGATWKRAADCRLSGAVIATIVAAMLLVTGPSAFAGISSADQAIATSINLRAGDLPGFKVQPKTGGFANPLNAKAKTACPGLAGAHHHPFISSPNFQRSSSLGVQAVQSQVQIEPSRRIAVADVAHLRSPKLPACYQRVFEGLTLPTSGGNVKVTGVSVKPLAVIVSGAGNAYGIRIKMVMTINGTHLPFQMDLIGLSVGRDLLNFFTGSLVEPLSVSMEHRLESLIVRRALTQPH